jgi:hypothetical protein
VIKKKKEKTAKEKISRRKIIGLAFIFISMILALANILSIKLTGAVVGIKIGSSCIIILTIVFFVMGLLFLSNLEKKIAAGIIAAGITVSGMSQITAPYWTKEGRFQRTYRWDKILKNTETKYKIPKGLLKGLAMRESYGDPLRLNSGGDGGAGLFMFAPGTAEAYGLKVIGSSKNTGVDKENGKELKKLVAINKNNYKNVAKIDERFDVKKSAKAAAHYIKDEYNKYGSWNKSLSAYNQGKPAPNPEKTEHVSKVIEYQKYYNYRENINNKSTNKNITSKGQVNKSVNKHR